MITFQLAIKHLHSIMGGFESDAESREPIRPGDIYIPLWVDLKATVIT